MTINNENTEEEKKELVECPNCHKMIYQNELCSCQRDEEDKKFIIKLKKND